MTQPRVKINGSSHRVQRLGRISLRPNRAAWADRLTPRSDADKAPKPVARVLRAPKTSTKHAEERFATGSCT